MEIKSFKINKLIEYARNPRKNDTVVDRMVGCIKEFGFRIPIVAKSDGSVVDGHLRLKAAKKLGMTEVPVVIADDLTDVQIKAFRLIANQSANWADWDEELLKLELEDLKNLNFDLDLTGFDLSEVERLLRNDDIEEDDYDDETLAEENVKPISKLGDLWILGNPSVGPVHRLLCGDATKESDYKKLLGEEIASLAFTDPPYGLDIVKGGRIGQKSDWRVCKSGNYRPIISDESNNTAREAFELFSKFSEKQIIWGGNYFTDFLPFSDGWIIWDKRCDSGIKNSFADGEMAWCSFHTQVRIYRQLWNGMVREYEREKRLHPTQKPVKITSKILTDFSKKNDLILDLFGGSGTTLIACEETDRRGCMMELDPKYVDTIIRRWQKHTGKQAILESTRKTFDEVMSCH
jgi:DNA modification methylase